MLRTALRPRWLGLLALVLVVMATFGMLGLWQLNVARDEGRAEAVRAAPTRPVADLSAVLTPHGPFPLDGDGRRITATGRYDGSAQVLVTPRRLKGRRGYWVVTPLVVRSTGARIAVVRGFVTDPAQAAPLVAAPGVTAPGATAPGATAPGATASKATASKVTAPEVTATKVTAPEVTVSGTLSPGESPADGTAPLPDGQVAAIDLSLLVNRWPGALYNAFIFATAEQPDVTSAAAPGLQRVPPPAPVGGGLSWRNAAYALQWWVFAAFAAYMWWRMVRDDHETERESDDDQSGETTDV